MPLIDSIITGLVSGFTFTFTIVFNKWLFEKRIESALNRLEKTIVEKIKSDEKTIQQIPLQEIKNEE